MHLSAFLRGAAALSALALVLAPSLAAQPFTVGNVLATQNDRLLEYTRSGTLVRNLAIPFPGVGSRDATDVVVDDLGRAHVLNIGFGGGSSVLSTYDPATGSWTHNPVTAFLGNVSDGDLARLGSTLYTKTESIQLPGYATTNITAQTGGAREVSVGLDGNLYALSSLSVRVLDPSDLSTLRTVTLLGGGRDPRGIAVDGAGEMFVADWDGNVYHHDNSGMLLNAAATGSGDLLDIDLARDGTLVVGSRFGNVVLFDTSLSSRTTISTGSNLAYVGMVEAGGALPVDDVGVTAITTPVSGPRLSNAEQLSVRIGNFGSQAQRNVPVTFSVTGPNGTVNAIETVTVTIPALSAVTYVYDTRLDLSLAGSYTIVAATQLPGDEDPSNDASTTTVVQQPVVTTFPYTEAFETGDGGYLGLGQGSTWQHGAPSGSFITMAASGQNAWVTNLDGAYGSGEVSYLQSPVLDLTGLAQDPIVAFSHTFGLWFLDGCWLEVSVDGGPFAKLGRSGDPGSTNWYNDPSRQWWDGNTTWRTASHLIPGAAGRTVQLRWVLQGSTPNGADGVGVDDVQVFAAPFGTGQAPRPLRALLDVNGAAETVGFPVSSGFPGPYFAAPSAASETLDIHVEAAASQPLILLAGMLNVGALQTPGGQLDLGPFEPLANGTLSSGLNPLFVTNTFGRMNFSVSIPPALVGQVMAMQTVVLQGGDRFLLTNAVEVTFVP